MIARLEHTLPALGSQKNSICDDRYVFASCGHTSPFKYFNCGRDPLFVCTIVSDASGYPKLCKIPVLSAYTSHEQTKMNPKKYHYNL